MILHILIYVTFNVSTVCSFCNSTNWMWQMDVCISNMDFGSSVNVSPDYCGAWNSQLHPHCLPLPFEISSWIFIHSYPFQGRDDALIEITAFLYFILWDSHSIQAPVYPSVFHSPLEKTISCWCFCCSFPCTGLANIYRASVLYKAHRGLARDLLSLISSYCLVNERIME